VHMGGLGGKPETMHCLMSKDKAQCDSNKRHTKGKQWAVRNTWLCYIV
jgi:hypothetical protein